MMAELCKTILGTGLN